MMRLVVILLLALTLAGCAGFGGRSEGQVSALREAIVLDALAQIGRPYRYGGKSPDGFDCSGLVHYVYSQAGVGLPRSSLEQYGAGRQIDLEKALPGDLLFYSFNGGRVDHVAIYLGDGRIVHAPATGRQVLIAPVSNKYWMQRFVGARRVLK